MDPETRRSLRALLECCDLPLLLVDPRDGRIREANEASGNLYGIPPGVLRDLSLADLEEAPDPPCPSRDPQVRTHRLAGGPGPVELRGVPVDGAPTLRLVSIRDLTDSRRRSRDLLRAEARYRDLLEAQPDPACLWGEGLEVRLANKAFLRLAETGEDGALRLSLADLLPPEERTALETLLKDPTGPGPLRATVRRSLRSGEIRREEWIHTPRPGAPGEIHTVVRDRTEELRSREERQRLLGLLEALDGGGRGPSFREAPEDLLRRTGDLLLRTGNYALVWFLEEDRRPPRGLVTLAAAGEGQDLLEALRASWEDPQGAPGPLGAPLHGGIPLVLGNLQEDPAFAPWIHRAEALGLRSCGAFPFCPEDRSRGALVLFSSREGGFPREETLLLGEIMRGVERDLRLGSHRRDQERALENQRDADARFQETRRMETLGRLAGGIAHDFNNLLQVILGHVELLREERRGDPGLQEPLDMVDQATRSAARLVRQLLAFAQREPHRLQTLDPREFLEEFAPLLRSAVGDRVPLRLELDPDLPPLTADRSKLEQVLLNLCLNARDAMPGGGTILLRGSLRTLDRSYRRNPTLPLREGTYLALSVVDSGAGFDEHLRERLFEPFFSTKGPDRGGGLGLATVYSIARQHGGLVEAENLPGSGARFTVLLPLTPPPNLSEEPSRRPPRRLLLHDPSPPLRQHLRQILLHLGFEVQPCATPEEFRHLWGDREERFDGALMGLSPREAPRPLLEDLFRLRQEPVLLLPPEGTAPEARRLCPPGRGCFVLPKPFTTRDLLETLQQFVPLEDPP